MVEYSLILLKGKGTKRRFNNERARLVSRRVNGGGWVSIQIEGVDESIKWRSKAWHLRAPTKRSLSLGDLQDDCLVHIFSFLGAGNSDFSGDEHFTDDELANNIDRSIDYVETKLLLQQAVNVHKSITFISKRFHRLCSSRLPEILGHLDADLFVNSWSRYTPWLTKYKLRLKSLKIKSDVFDDAAILLYILQRCDVSKLTTLSACFKKYGPTHHERPYNLVELETSSLVHVGNRLVLSDDYSVLSLRAANLGLPNLYERRVTSRRELYDDIAVHCPAICNLKVVHDLGDHGVVDPDFSSSDLFEQSTIRRLHLVLYVVTDESRRFNFPFYTSSVSEAISQLPNLKVFKLGNGQNQIIHDQKFDLSSGSLQFIDLREAGKNNWVTRCVCPNLKRLMCLSTAYGNGVRPSGDDSVISLINGGPPPVGDFYAATTRFDGTLEWNRRTVVFQGLEVPSDCVVTLFYYF